MRRPALAVEAVGHVTEVVVLPLALALVSAASAEVHLLVIEPHMQTSRQ